MPSAPSSVRPCRFAEIYLHTDSESFDLHNCFDFTGFSYDTTARTVRLRWIRNEYGTADWPRSLVVEMRDIEHLSATSRDSEMPFSEDTCLSTVGGVAPTEPTVEGVYSDVASGLHHIFTFQSGFVLRIGAESVHLVSDDI